MRHVLPWAASKHHNHTSTVCRVSRQQCLQTPHPMYLHLFNSVFLQQHTTHDGSRSEIVSICSRFENTLLPNCCPNCSQTVSTCSRILVCKQKSVFIKSGNAHFSNCPNCEQMLKVSARIRSDNHIITQYCETLPQRSIKTP